MTWVKQDALNPRQFSFELNQAYELAGDYKLKVEATSETYPTKSPLLIEIDLTVESPCLNADLDKFTELYEGPDIVFSVGSLYDYVNVTWNKDFNLDEAAIMSE